MYTGQQGPLTTPLGESSLNMTHDRDIERDLQESLRSKLKCIHHCQNLSVTRVSIFMTRCKLQREADVWTLAPPHIISFIATFKQFIDNRLEH